MHVISKRKLVKFVNIIIMTVIIFFLSSVGVTDLNTDVTTNASNVSNKKIGWGIKRNDNHEQPDVGANNKKLLDENNGICLGNKDDKVIYLTFDEGYEAGYTAKLLETLKENNVKATFFITAHYVNTQPELVKQMIDEGHIVGNHTPKHLMSGNCKIIKC